MYISPKLKQFRKQNQLSQETIGQLLHTTQQQYYKYEKGIQEIPVHHLITLASYYGVSLNDLVETL